MVKELETKAGITIIDYEPPRPAQKVFGALISGLSPLLMHAPTAILDQTEQSPRSRTKPGPEMAERAAYRTADGYLCIRADHIRMAMVNAAKHLKYHGRRTIRADVSRGVRIIDPEFLILRNGEPLTAWDEIDIRPVNIKGNRVPAYRPMVKLPWSAEVRLEFDQAYIPGPKFLAEILSHAGYYVGIMDYRPERGGPFGRFEVVRVWVEEV